MIYWTLLVIHFGAPFEGYQSALPYPSPKACGEAIVQWQDQPMVRCVVLDIPSSSIRPQSRSNHK